MIYISTINYLKSELYLTNTNTGLTLESSIGQLENMLNMGISVVGASNFVVLKPELVVRAIKDSVIYEYALTQQASYESVNQSRKNGLVINKMKYILDRLYFHLKGTKYTREVRHRIFSEILSELYIHMNIVFNVIHDNTIVGKYFDYAGYSMFIGRDVIEIYCNLNKKGKR